ncbi:MAG TPA: AraC family transcriptional regulator [Dongiaceae bacterium]|nr:AraC family transcriptional regulator [Dongiaceae bacterium]
MKIGDTTASYISYLLESAVTLGASVDRLLADAELNPRELLDGDNRIDLTYLMRLGYGAIRQTGRPDLGLVLGRQSSMARFGHAGLAAMTAPTLGDALEILTKYEPLQGRCYRGSSRLTRAGQQTQLEFYSIAPYNDYTYFVVDAVLGGWYQFIQWITGRQDLVSQVLIEFSTPNYYEAYSEAFPCGVRFHQEINALVLKPGALATPLVHSDPTLNANLLRTCDELLSQVAMADSYRNKVLKVLGTMLHGKTPSIEEVAHQLCSPPCTLRRTLKDEYTAYQNLVDEMRKDVALSYMKNTELSFGEIAYLLGFSTPGAFQRAFKRWAGTTPGEYRKSLEIQRK